MNNISWQTADRKQWRIAYIQDNKQKNYYPDFVTDTHIIEIKPLKLQHLEINKLKKQFGELFAAKIGMIYEMKDVKLLDTKFITLLIDEGLVQLLPKYGEKFDKLYR